MTAKQTNISISTTALVIMVGVAILAISVALSSVVNNQSVSAAPVNTIPDADMSGGSSTSGSGGSSTSGGCGGVETSIIKCDESGGPGSSVEDSGIWGVLKLAIQIMTAGVGVLAVGGILWGAIMYASAGGSTEQTKKGIAVIKNTVIGLLLYVFMFAIINFLIPGGVLT